MSSGAEPSRIAYIALGSNLGDRCAHLDAAAAFLGSGAGLELLRLSSYHETPPVGPPQPDYLNAVAEVRTDLAPWALLRALKAYEREAGRVASERWGPRIIDLDIVLLGDVQLADEGLCIPHKALPVRSFVLAPLAELAPELVPPGSSDSISALLAALSA